jgi:rRNA maturation endonuclease Nob1
MLEKLKNRLENIRDTTQNLGASLLTDKVSDEIQAYRYNICQECPKLYKPTDTCKVCGCFMKVKTWMPKQSCPLKKWDKAI